MESKFETIEDFDIHYQVAGKGASTLLLIHGAVGSVNDFAVQMSEEFGLNKDEFTIIAFDLPGYGKSTSKKESLPEDVMPTREYFELCAKIGAKLMQKLNYKTYSVGGWSDGARVASLLAIRNQSRVDALLLWGFVPIMDVKSCNAIARTRDTSTWNPEALQFYSSVYGEEKFSELWRKYVDYIVYTLELPDHFDIRRDLCQIKCPTMILHGSNDPIVNFKEHVKPLEMQIYNSEIVQLKGLSHNIHQANPNKFNQLLTTLVTSVRV